MCKKTVEDGTSSIRVLYHSDTPVAPGPGLFTLGDGPSLRAICPHLSHVRLPKWFVFQKQGDFNRDNDDK